MIIINVIKMLAIWLTDGINRLIYPFEEARFSPPIDLKELEPKLAKHLEDNFKDGPLFLYEKPMPEDAGDHALFHGLYTAYRALKGGDISDALEGLEHFIVNDTLIRGYYANGTANTTTSNDSATGVLFALYCIHQYNGHAADGLIRGWVSQIVAANYALTDLDGDPTKYGQLDDGWKTDPLRITLLLALLALASKIDSSFDSIYERIYQKYREILPYPKVKLLWWDTDYDTHRAAIHLHILWQLTRDTTYKAGLRRLHRITRAESNPWVNILCSPVLDPEIVNLSVLNTFDVTMRDKGNIAAMPVNTDVVKWGGNVRAKQPMALWLRGSQEFFWQRNMFSINEWPKNEVAKAHHSNLDFLVAYWLAMRIGLTSQLSGVKL